MRRFMRKTEDMAEEVRERIKANKDREEAEAKEKAERGEKVRRAAADRAQDHDADMWENGQEDEINREAARPRQTKEGAGVRSMTSGCRETPNMLPKKQKAKQTRQR